MAGVGGAVPVRGVVDLLLVVGGSEKFSHEVRCTVAVLSRKRAERKGKTNDIGGTS